MCVGVLSAGAGSRGSSLWDCLCWPTASFPSGGLHSPWAPPRPPTTRRISALEWNLLEICWGTRTHLKSQSFHIIFFFSVIYFSTT